MAILEYALQNEDYLPISEQWCDLIEVDKDCFVCPFSKNSRCSYVLNENLSGKKWTEIPPDTVLLFETFRDEWNQTGGPCLLDFANHHQDRYTASVVFADGTVEFIRPEDCAELKWKVESK